MLKRILETSACAGKTINLGTQAPEVTIREVVETCIDISGKSLGIRVLSPTPDSPERRAPDMGLTKELIDFESRISLRKGIELTWAWYHEYVFEMGRLTAR